jgi:hypothetical protein
MLRSIIVAAIPLVSLFSIASIADTKERSIDRQATRHSHQPLLHLTTKKSQPIIPQADLQGIHQAMSAYYRNKNQALIPARSKNQNTKFFEVKSLTLISFSSNVAVLDTEVDQKYYTLTPTSIKKAESSRDKTETLRFKLEKVSGKWQLKSDRRSDK